MASTATKFRLSVTLRDGSTVSRDVARMPRFWKSWLMQECRYGTDFFGCSFSREAL